MIKITNYRDYDFVSYSLPLLIGNIGGVTNGEIYVKNLTRASTNYVPWPVIKGKFKVLVNLLPGHNRIILKYNSSKRILNLEYIPLKFEKYVRLVYIVCCDDNGDFQSPPREDSSKESACRRITLGAQMLQTFTAENLNAQGLGFKTFRLEETKGQPICHVFRSSMRLDETWTLSENELWERFAIELMSSPLRDKDNCKFLAVLSFTQYVNNSDFAPRFFEEIKSMTSGYAALATGGLALVGSACLHTWPETLAEIPLRFGDCRDIDRMLFMDDSNNRGTYWACYATNLGAMLHELGHIFNLGHTVDGIMDRGFDNIHRFFIIDSFYYNHPFQRKHNPHYQTCFGERASSASLTYNNGWASTLQAVTEVDKLKISNASKKRPPWRVPYPTDVNQNDAFWSRSSALILCYHKWFNDYPDDNDSIQKDGTVFSSSHGIRIIEFRDEVGTAFHHREFLEGRGASEINISLPDFDPCVPENVKNFSVHVEDNLGNIISHTFPSESSLN